MISKVTFWHCLLMCVTTVWTFHCWISLLDFLHVIVCVFWWWDTGLFDDDGSFCSCTGGELWIPAMDISSLPGERGTMGNRLFEDAEGGIPIFSSLILFVFSGINVLFLFAFCIQAPQSRFCSWSHGHHFYCRAVTRSCLIMTIMLDVLVRLLFILGVW